MAKKVGKRISHECRLPNAGTITQDEVWACECGKEYYADAGGTFAGGPRWVPVDGTPGPDKMVHYFEPEQVEQETKEAEEAAEAEKPEAQREAEAEERAREEANGENATETTGNPTS